MLSHMRDENITDMDLEHVASLRGELVVMTAAWLRQPSNWVAAFDSTNLEC